MRPNLHTFGLAMLIGGLAGLVSTALGVVIWNGHHTWEPDALTYALSPLFFWGYWWCCYRIFLRWKSRKGEE